MQKFGLFLLLSRFSLFPQIAIFFFESCEQRLRLPVDLLRLAVSEVLGCVEMGKQYKCHVKCTSGAARDKRIL